MRMFKTVCYSALTLATFSVVASTTASAFTKRHGCYQVTAPALNIRKRAWARSAVVAVVSRGDVLTKRRRWCAIRGFWCPVWTGNKVVGWADKKFLRKIACR